MGEELTNTGRSRHSSTGDIKGIGARRKTLQQIKRCLEFPEDCNSKKCSLRSNKEELSKDCKCLSTFDHCYFCYQHVCEGCADKMDRHEAGLRRCKPLECIVREENWEIKTITSPKHKTDQKPFQKTRCRICSACKSNCVTMKTETSQWCNICQRKVRGESTWNKACQKRND